MSKSLMSLSMTTANVNASVMEPGDELRLFRELEKGIRICLQNPADQNECIHTLSKILVPQTNVGLTRSRRTEVPIINESDIVTARSLGRDMCKEIGFSPTDQVKLATAVSELARNIVQYGGRGRIVLTALNGTKPGLEVCAHNERPAIENVDFVLSGQYRSKIGIGRGLAETRNLVDDLDIQADAHNGTTVTARKYLI
ncbi:MAG: anti-sigma regulatory factor [Proteobacteria bacterium]|nr:anti-sigma regulatory factor [Pseudomonadota bacterium]